MRARARNSWPQESFVFLILSNEDTSRQWRWNVPPLTWICLCAVWETHNSYIHVLMSLFTCVTGDLHVNIFHGGFFADLWRGKSTMTHATRRNASQPQKNCRTVEPNFLILSKCEGLFRQMRHDTVEWYSPRSRMSAWLIIAFTGNVRIIILCDENFTLVSWCVARANKHHRHRRAHVLINATHTRV